MTRNPTVPAVITDVNGKVTTVHRRAAPSAGRVIPNLPMVSASKQRVSQQAELLSLRQGLSDRAKETGMGILESYAAKAYRDENIYALRALDKFADGTRGPGHIIGAVAILRKHQQDPDEHLNAGNVDAVCNVREEFTQWAGKHLFENQLKTFGLDRDFEEVLMFVLEDPSREAMVLHAIRDLNIGNLEEIKKLDMGTPPALIDGVL